MAAEIEELFKGRSEVMSGGKSSAELPYIVRGAASEAEVRQVAAAQTPLTYEGLLRKAIEIAERVNEDSWRVSVRYEVPDPEEQEEPEPVITFDGTGGTQHITQSLETVGRYGPAASEQLGGAIGYDGENVAGVDITVPVWQFTETHYLDDEDVDWSAYYDLIGKVNSDVFRGYQPGELLFLGPTGQKRGDEKWEVAFKFAAQRNRANFMVGDISVASKKGWEYLWVQYGDDVDTTAKVRIKKPVAVYVEKVYESAAFAGLGI